RLAGRPFRNGPRGEPAALPVGHPGVERAVRRPPHRHARRAGAAAVGLPDRPGASEGAGPMTEALCLGVVLALAQAPKPPGANTPGSPPPLTEDQLTRIRKLADDTQKEAVRLKTLLDHRQKELAGVYSKYDLDEKRATQLETEILDIQKKMLANYRKMQV